MTEAITTWDDASIADLIRRELKLLHHTETAVDWGASIVAALRDKGVLPSVGNHDTNDCGSLVMGCVEELTARLAERGYPHLRAQIWVSHEPGKHTVVIHGKDDDEIPYIGSRATLSELMAHARERIASAPDGNAYDAWFAWPQSGEAA